MKIYLTLFLVSILFASCAYREDYGTHNKVSTKMNVSNNTGTSSSGIEDTSNMNLELKIENHNLVIAGNGSHKTLTTDGNIEEKDIHSDILKFPAIYYKILLIQDHIFLIEKGENDGKTGRTTFGYYVYDSRLNGNLKDINQSIFTRYSIDGVGGGLRMEMNAGILSIFIDISQEDLDKYNELLNRKGYTLYHKASLEEQPIDTYSVRINKITDLYK